MKFEEVRSRSGALRYLRRVRRQLGFLSSVVKYLSWLCTGGEDARIQEGMERRYLERCVTAMVTEPAPWDQLKLWTPGRDSENPMYIVYDIFELCFSIKYRICMF